MSILQDQHLKLLDEFDVLKGDLESTSKQKVSGRLDLTRMYLARSKWHGADCIFKSHLMSRDILHWFQDFYILTNAKNKDPSKVITK